MALTRLNDFDTGTYATEAKLEGEFDRIYNNALALISPLTGNLACGGYRLTGLSAGSVSAPGLAITGDDDTGLWASAADTVDVSVGGNRGLQVTGVTGAVNYLDIAPSATSNALTVTAEGTDTNISMSLVTKGTGGVLIPDGAIGTPAVAFADDTNTGLWSSAADIVDISVGGVRGLQVSTVASAVNYLDIAPSAAGSPLTLTAEGTDTNVGVSIIPKGTGSVLVPDGAIGTPAVAFSADTNTGPYRAAADVYAIAAGGVDAARFSTVASAVNYLDIAPSATGNALTITAAGTDTNISMSLVPKGTGQVLIPDGSITAPAVAFASDTDVGFYRPAANALAVVGQGGIMMRFNSAASAVNYLIFSPHTAGNSPAIEAAGSDTNINVLFYPKGTGGVGFPDGAVGTPAMRFTDDLDTGFYRSGSDRIDLAAGGVRALQVTGVASAVNYLDIAPSATTNALTLTAEGTDTNIGMSLVPKGTGGVLIPAGAVGTPAVAFAADTDTGIYNASANVLAVAAGGVDVVRFPTTASAVNYLQFTPSATGFGVLVDAAGSDTNIGLYLAGKGTGNVNINTANALVPAAVSGTPAQHGLFRENVVKAWALVGQAAGTFSLTDSFNVSGISDDGVGLYTLSWDRDFANTTYVAASVHQDTVTGFCHPTNSSKAVGSLQFRTYDTAGTLTDFNTPSGVIAIGDQ